PQQEQAFDFQYSYEKETRDLAFLSLLDFRKSALTDSFHIVIDLPLAHTLHYQLEDSLKQSAWLQIKEEEIAGHRRYVFEGRPARSDGYPTGIGAMIRLMVTPNGGAPYDYYNDWYRMLVRPTAVLGEDLKKEIRQQVAGMEEDRQRIETIFNLIKDRTSYIAFEEGLGAVQPRDVNRIWMAQQGDCKDMSNLLCSALRELGYEAHLALSATIGHHFDLDFPSVASANHAICVLKLADHWLYLDATEDSGFYAYPSRQIQGRNIFIIDEEAGQLHRVPVVASQSNRVLHRVQLAQQGSRLEGEVNYEYFGLSQLTFRDAQKLLAQSRLQQKLQKYLAGQSANLNYKDLELLVQDSTCQIKARIRSDRNITTIRNKHYLSLAFLPKPNRQVISSDAVSVHFYETSHRDFAVELTLDQPIILKAFEPVEVSENGLHFSFQVDQTAPNQLTIEYRYINELLKLEGDQLQTFRNIDQLIEQTFQKSIIYEDPT
ncbi:MAG: transglutaminase domain-containing protein, partial [Bacteroidota bacterium]